jgi:hypothetical protein
MTRDQVKELETKLERWIGERRPDPSFGGGAVSAAGAEGHLRHVLAMSRLLAEGIAATADHIEVKDKNSYDFISSRLGDLLDFREFSLAEYTFTLEKGRNPGIRLMLERCDAESQLTVIGFEDVLQWRVDHEGRKLQQILVVLRLGNDDITIAAVEGTNKTLDASKPWQSHLREAFVSAVTRVA